MTPEEQFQAYLLGRISMLEDILRAVIEDGGHGAVKERLSGLLSAYETSALFSTRSDAENEALRRGREETIRAVLP